MNKEELLIKLQSLAQQGVGGEKENAKALLNKLMKKYDITENDLNKKEIMDFFIRYTNKYDRELIAQVFYSIVGDINPEKSVYMYKHTKQKLFIYCTKAEYIELVAKYNFYKYHLAKDFDLFYAAFVQKNNIFAPPNLLKENKPKALTEKDCKILNIADKLDKHSYLLQIDHTSKL